MKWAGYEIDDMVDKMEKGRSTISRWLNDEAIPDLANIERWARVCGGGAALVGWLRYDDWQPPEPPRPRGRGRRRDVCAPRDSNPEPADYWSDGWVPDTAVLTPAA